MEIQVLGSWIQREEFTKRVQHKVNQSTIRKNFIMLHRINIFQSLYERLPLPKGLPPILVGGSPLPDHEDSNDLGRGRESFSLRLVPDYFQLGNLPPGYDLKSVPQDNWGHSIDLNEVSSVDQYMESQFKSKPRSII